MKWKLLTDGAIFIFMIVIGSYIGCKLSQWVEIEESAGVVTITAPAKQNCNKEGK